MCVIARCLLLADGVPVVKSRGDALLFLADSAYLSLRKCRLHRLASCLLMHRVVHMLVAFAAAFVMVSPGIESKRSHRGQGKGFDRGGLHVKLPFFDWWMKLQR